MAKFGFDDDSVVVIIGSGRRRRHAGGNELCQKGIKVVVPAQKRGDAVQRQLHQRRVEVVRAQLAWLDARTTRQLSRAKDFPGLPAWISARPWVARQPTGAGASLRFQEREFKVRTQYGHIGAPIRWTGRSSCGSSSRGTRRPKTRWA